MLDYNEWNSYKDIVKSEAIPKELSPILSAVHNFHSQNGEHKNLSVPDLGNLLMAVVSRDPEYYRAILEQIDKLDVSKETTHVLINSLLNKQKLKEISLATYQVTEGKKNVEDIRALLEDFLKQEEKPTTADADFDFVTDNLYDLANAVVKTPGLRWRHKTLNRMLGSLRKGDFGLVFARPETGKTTFLADAATFFAEQLKENDGPIIWLNNEEGGEKVKLRIYQSTAGVPLTRLLSDLEGYQKRLDQILRGKIKLVDRAAIHKKFVEKLCHHFKPSLLIFDQIDKIQGFDADREDLHLGAIYIWARELAKTYCPVIAVCQADGTGENAKWLTMAHVANAKTSKQAEMDWILGIGKVNDVGYENIRYLHLSKNKLLGDDDTDPNLRHGRMEMLIDPTVARYKDIL